jgi:hypothetical protein
MLFHKRIIVAAWLVLSFSGLVRPVSAELNSGDTLDKTTWQEAKGMMPDAILRRFEDGRHISKIIELPPEGTQWGSRFLKLTEANAGKYAIGPQGYLVETATGTWPHYMDGGFPFPQIEPNDPSIALKIMYNFALAGGPVDDVDVYVNIFWVSAGGLERYVDLRGQALSYGARWSGPIDNPDEVSGKVLVFGVAPYDAVGLATLSWGYLDPDKWTSVWAFVPVLRRVRRLSAANTSDGLFGSHFSRDDGGTFSGKIHYFNWKLIGEKEALVPYTLPTPKTWKKTERGLLLPAEDNAAIMPWRGKSKLFDQSGTQWAGAAWWPTNLYMTKRPVWLVEAVAKDPYYSYGRQVIWIDKELFRGYYKEVYDRAGQYWKTILVGGGQALSEDKVFSTRQADFGLAIDEHATAANVVLPLREGNDIRINVGLDPENFSYQGLTRFGK